MSVHWLYKHPVQLHIAHWLRLRSKGSGVQWRPRLPTGHLHRRRTFNFKKNISIERRLLDIHIKEAGRASLNLRTSLSIGMYISYSIFFPQWNIDLQPICCSSSMQPSCYLSSFLILLAAFFMPCLCTLWVPRSVHPCYNINMKLQCVPCPATSSFLHLLICWNIFS